MPSGETSGSCGENLCTGDEEGEEAVVSGVDSKEKVILAVETPLPFKAGGGGDDGKCTKNEVMVGSGCRPWRWGRTRLLAVCTSRSSSSCCCC